MLGVGNPGRVDMRYMLKTKTYQYKTNIELGVKVILSSDRVEGWTQKKCADLDCK